jgi:purine-nucleoside phosphorylase
MPTRSHLSQLQQAQLGFSPQSNVILMGLCGSLSPQLFVGDSLVCQRCIDLTTTPVVSYECDRLLSQYVMQQMSNTAKFATCLTSDRLVESAAEKCQLGATHRADVVDMEGAAILNFLQYLDVNLTILRVVSDNCTHDLPAISTAIDSQGRLRTLPLMSTLMLQPIRAVQLVRSSLRALIVLQQRTVDLFTPSSN